MKQLLLIATFGLSTSSVMASDLDPFGDNWYCAETLIFSRTQEQERATEDNPFTEQISLSGLRTYSRTLIPLQFGRAGAGSNGARGNSMDTFGWWMTDDQARSSNTNRLWHYPAVKPLASADPGYATSVMVGQLETVGVDVNGSMTLQPSGIPPSGLDQVNQTNSLEHLEAWLLSSSFKWYTERLGFRLTKTRLRRDGYGIIGHGMWFQPVPDRSAPIPLLLQLGGQMATGLYEVEGTISMTRGRYLHLDVQLWMNEQGSLIGQQNSFIELRESRRMRSREVHYLDHPAFGMLVNVVPADVPQLAKAVLESRHGASDNVEEIGGALGNSGLDGSILDWSIAAACSGIYD